jgi:hypothetical protein
VPGAGLQVAEAQVTDSRQCGTQRVGRGGRRQMGVTNCSIWWLNYPDVLGLGQGCSLDYSRANE